MKRIIRYVSIVLLCSFLCGTVVEAHGTELYSQQSNNSRRNNKGSKDKKDNDRKAPERRPGNSGNNRPGNAPASRPQQRPSNNNSNKKPQQNNGKHDRPGGNVITRPSRRPEITTTRRCTTKSPVAQTNTATGLLCRRRLPTTATNITITTARHLRPGHTCLRQDLITDRCRLLHGMLRLTGIHSVPF